MIACENCGSCGLNNDRATGLPDGWLVASLPARDAGAAHAGQKITIQERDVPVCSERCRDALLQSEEAAARMMRRPEDK